MHVVDAIAFALGHAASLGLLLALFLATGYGVEVLARPLVIAALGPQLVRITVGVIAWMALLFVLAATGAYAAVVALPLAAGVIVAALAHHIRAGGGVRPWLRTRAVGLRALAVDLRAAPLLVPTALVLLALFVLALAPRIGWDDNTYHLTLPKLYLARGGFVSLPFSHYGHWPQNVELLYGLALMLHDYVLAKLLHWLFLVLLLAATFRVCRQHAGLPLAALATLLVLGNDVVLFEASIAYIDLAFAFFLIIAVASAAETPTARDDGLLLAGLCCGALAGCKISGLAGIACVLPVALLTTPERRQRLPRTLLTLGLPTVLLGAPWYIKSWLETGNPLYPLLFSVFGGLNWNAHLDDKFHAWHHAIGMGRTLRDDLLLPWRLVLDGGPGYAHFDGRIAHIWLALAPLALLAAFRLRPVRPYLLAAAVYFAVWAAGSQQMRFLIALLPLLAVAGTLALQAGVQLLSRRQAAQLAVTAVWLVTAGVLLPEFRLTLRNAADEATVLLQRGPGGAAEVTPPGYAYLNRATPLTAKVMLINTNHGFFLDRTYIADSVFEASQMRELVAQAGTEAELAALFAQLGLTHVYLSAQATGIEFPSILWQFLGNNQRVRLVFECPDRACFVFALLPP